MAFRLCMILGLFLTANSFLNTQTLVQFEVCEVPNSDDVKVGIRGNLEPLSWEKSIFLRENAKSGCYEVEIELESSGVPIEYKFVIEDGEEVKWEGISNRSEFIKSIPDTLYSSTWDVEKFIDPSALPLLSVEELKEDFLVIKNAILKVHPGLYRYNSKEEILTNLGILEQQLNRPLSYSEAFLAFSKFITTIECDHTSASYWNQEGTMNSLLHRMKNKIPFTFLWIDGKMIIVKNASESEQLKPGTEVLSINGHNTADVLETLLPYISADGHTIHNKIRKAEVDGLTFRFSSFDVLFPLLFPMDSDFSLELAQPRSNEVLNVNVAALTTTERAIILEQRYPEFETNPEDLWEARILSDRIAYLKIGSFGTNRFSINWKDYLEDYFAKFNNEAIDLIIDIRENQGGMDDASYELQKYLFKDKCSLDLFQSQSRFLVFPEEVKSHIQTWDYWFYNLENDKHFKQGEYYVFPRNQSKIRLGPSDQTFKGNIYLLTSGKNVSGAFYLSNVLRECGEVTIIGEETGGNLNGVNGGAILFLKPPNSRININLPVVGSFSKSSKENRGVRPDVVAYQTREDLIDGKDTVLEKAINTILANR